MRSKALRPAQLALWIATTFAVVVSHADDSFREFPDAEVMRPVELFRALVEMQNLPPELLEQAKRMSANLSPSEPLPDLGFRFDQDPSGTRPVPGKQGKQGDGRPGAPKAPGGPQGPPQGAPKQGPGSGQVPSQPGSLPPGATPGSGAGAPPGPGTPPGTPPGSGQRPNGTNFPNTAPTTPGGSPSPPQTPPRRKASETKSRERSAERARGGRNENFRQRMNRILLNAAREASQREADGEPRNVLERLLEKAQEQVAESVNKSSPETRRKWRERLQQVGKNAQGERQMEWLNSSPAESPSSTPSRQGGSTWMLWLLAAAGVAAAVGIAAYRRGLQSPAQRLARQRARRGKRVQLLIRDIRTHRQLIDALDELVLWRHGDEASSWDSVRVQTMLRKAQPQSTSEINELVRNYTLAKYSPTPDPLNTDQLAASAATLESLVASAGHVETLDPTGTALVRLDGRGEMHELDAANEGRV